MTNEEFSNEFDVLYNSITSNQAPGLDEYEKSVFLTKAQLEILREYFNSRVDGTNGGFDGSQKRQYDFSQLIRVSNLTEKDGEEAYNVIDYRSKCYEFPEDYFLSVNEIIYCEDAKKQYSVVSISYSDYQRLMTKPYAYPPKNSAWRLITGVTQYQKTVKNEDGQEEEETVQVPVAEVIGKFAANPVLRLRYVKRPQPIVLIDLDPGLSIDKKSEQTQCELPAQLHQEILERAVTLAKIAYQGGTTSTLNQQKKSNQ